MAEKPSYAFHDVFGALILIGALFALGLFNFKSDEPLVEAGLRAQTQTIASQALHEVKITVDGRDITIAGLTNSEDEKAALIAALRALEGRGKLRGTFEVLAPMAPFELKVQRDAQGLSWSGGVPTEDIRSLLRGAFGDGVDALTLASGAPDMAWGDVVRDAARALYLLETGQLSLQDRAVTLRGAALTPDVLGRVGLILEDLPKDYALETDISLLDDGTPLRLSAARRDGEDAPVSGKLPHAMAESLSGDEISRSPLGEPFDGWQDGVRLGLDALSHLHSGFLAVSDATLTLTGDAWSKEAYAAVQAALAAMPEEMQVSADIRLADSGAPFGLSLTLDATGAASASGKVPRSLAAPVLEALLGRQIETSALEVARVSPPDIWWHAASLGVQALRSARHGMMQLEERRLSLSLLLDDLAAQEALEALLNGVDERFEKHLDITLIDDGTPLRLSLSLSDGIGRADGKWPEELALIELSEAAGQPFIAGDVILVPRPGSTEWAEAARLAAGAMTWIRNGRLELSGTELRLDGHAADPADKALVEAHLARLPSSFSAITDIAILDDGRPFAFEIVYDGTSAHLSGKTPSDLGPASQSAIMDVPVLAEKLDVAMVTADAEWWHAARSGLRALARLRSGRLTMDAYQITLTGIAPDQASRDQITRALAAFDEAFTVQVDLILP